MRILLVWDFYERHLTSYLAAHGGAAGRSYRDQVNDLLQEAPAWPALLVPRLNELGHQAEVIVGNAAWLQERWLRDSGITGALAPADVLVEQIKRFQPDVIWIVGAEHYLGEFIRRAKRLCPCVIAWRGVDWSPNLDWSGVDLVLTSHQPLLDEFRRQGIPAKRLLPCFEERVLSHLDPVERPHGVVFVGSLNSVQYGERRRLLLRLSKRVPLTLFVDVGWQRRPIPLLPWLRQLEVVDLLRHSTRSPAVFGLKMLSVLAAAELVINVHVDCASGFAGNIRMFETTGVGTALLTEAAPNLKDLFEPGLEVFTYRSVEEAAERVEYCLTHDEETRGVARLGQARTLRDHSALQRASEFADIASALVGELAE